MDVDTRPAQDLSGVRLPQSQTDESINTQGLQATQETGPTTQETTTTGQTGGQEGQEVYRRRRGYRRGSYQKPWSRPGQGVWQEKEPIGKKIEADDLMRGITGICTGLALGFVLEKSKIYLPYIIREQVLLHNFAVLKMFLAAILSGTVAVALIDALSYGFQTGGRRRGSVTAQTAQRAADVVPTRGEVKSALFKNYDGNVVGGILLGIGIALSGSLPGAVFLQIGAGVDKSLWVVAGAMLGIFIYSSLERQGFRFGPRHVPSQATTSGRTGFQISAGSAMMIAGVISFVLYWLETTFPWQSEISPILKVKGVLPPVGHGSFTLADSAWSPIEAGLVAGILQVPVFLWSRNALAGKASNYLSALSYFIYGIDPRANVGQGFFEREKKADTSDFWNVAFVVGILLGAYFSNYLSGNSAILTNPVTRPEAFLGGLLLLLGARIATQSTQAHLTRNVMEISLATLFTLLPMLGSAMVTAHLLW